MQVQLHHTHIFASNVEATVKWWQDMLDAQVLFDMEIAGARNVMLGIGSGRLNIYDQPPRQGEGGACHHLGIQTDDLDTLVEHMKSRGFRFQGKTREHGYLRYIMAMAPDGILLEIFQVLTEKASPDRQKALRKAFAFQLLL